MTPDSSSNNTGTVVACTMVAILLLVLCAVYGFYYVKKSRKYHGKYGPSDAEYKVNSQIKLEDLLSVTYGERLI